MASSDRDVPMTPFMPARSPPASRAAVALPPSQQRALRDLQAALSEGCVPAADAIKLAAGVVAGVAAGAGTGAGAAAAPAGLVDVTVRCHVCVGAAPVTSVSPSPAFGIAGCPLVRAFRVAVVLLCWCTAGTLGVFPELQRRGH